MRARHPCTYEELEHTGYLHAADVRVCFERAHVGIATRAESGETQYFN